MKKIYYVILIIAALWISGCRTIGYNSGSGSGSIDINLTHHIAFAIDDISFQDDGLLLGEYNTYGMNNLHLNMNVSDSGNTEIELNIPIEFDYYNNPTAVYNDDIYVLNANSNSSYSSLQVYSIFQSKQDTETKDIRDVDTSKISLRNNTLNNIQLKYTTTETSVLTLELSGDEIKYGRVPNGFNFKVNYEVVHEGTPGVHNKVNLIIMAEGFRADQMDIYKHYVADAFKDASSFHDIKASVENIDKLEHITNVFFEEYWDQIRVVRLDTMSPQSGVDQTNGIDDVQSILNFNVSKEDERRYCEADRIKKIINMSLNEMLKLNELDAVIVFVNDKECDSYTSAYNNELSFKYGQPINVVIIQTPVDGNFFTILTTSIAHELGHALARLQDEYEDKRKAITFEYKSKYRNISSSTNVKWQKLIDKGYGGGTENNFLLKTYEGCLYTPTGLYRPTFTSTMRQTDYKDDLQFGPVNTYHLAATFKIRTSSSDPNVKDLSCDDDPENYEWEHYSIEQFEEEWPLEKFQ